MKSRTRPMLGFKNFDCAAITIAGVEVLHRIRKSQAVVVYGSKAKLHPRSGMQFLAASRPGLARRHSCNEGVCTRALFSLP